MTREQNGTAVLAEGLRRQFNGTTAVEGLDLEITQGEIYGFLGPNGAGKSTTVRMLCTLLAPTGGRATVAGHDVATDPGAVRLRIGAALQDVALDPKLVRRRVRPSNRREYTIDISDGGRAIVDAVTVARRRDIQRLLGRIPARRRQQLVGTLRALGDAAGEPASPVSPLGWAP
jgi:ABC-2 type transport system ATP-binding protein